MLMMDENASALVRVVSDLIGYRLSSLPSSSGGTLPSVIRNRTGSFKPEFPYAVVDYVNVNKTGYGQRASYLDENEDEVDEFDYVGRFLIQIQGGIDDDVLSICTECGSRLLTSKGKRKFKMYFQDQGLKSGLLSISSPLFTPSRLATDFEESARITVDIWMRSVIVDETTDVIQDVEVNGELCEDFDQVNPPLDVNVIAP